MSDHGEGAGGPGPEPVPEPLTRLRIKVPSPKKFPGDGEDLEPEAFDRWYNSVQLYLRLHNVSQKAAGSGNYWILYTEGRAQEAAFQAAELFGENLTRDQLVTYLRERFQSSKHKDDTYLMFHSIRQSWNGQVQKISIIATDLLMHRSRLPEDTISDYAFIQQFFTSMHPRLRQDVETQYTGDEDINPVIAMAERLDCIQRSTGAYSKERYDKQSQESTTKKTEHKHKKKFNNDGNSAKKKEQRKKGACFTCGGEGHMAKDRPNKKDKAKRKVKKEASSNLATELCEYDQVYINALEIESYVATKATRPTTIKAHYALEGTMFINGTDAKVLFDTGTIGASLISAAFVTTHSIPCIEMKQPTRILLMAMKGARSESNKECTVDHAVGKLHTKGNKMLVGNLAKYDALIGMPFLKQQVAIIECGGLAIEFPKFGIRMNCTPTSGHIRAAVVTIEDVISQHTEVFPEAIPEGLLPLRKINHEIRLIPGKQLRNLPTYSIPERWAQDMSLWINEKVEQGIIERKAVHGAAPIFAQEKKDKIRMRPLVDLTARNKITIKDDEMIPNQRMILNSLGRARYRSKIYLSDAYFQTRVEPKDVDKNGFKSPFGCFVSKVMLQGDMNAPATFTRIMSDLFADYQGQFIWVYIDDILIYSDTEQDHQKHIAMVCDKQKQAQFYTSRKKSEFFAASMDVLGHIIDDQGLRASPEKIARIEAWTTPKNKKQLQEFLGVVNYISQFIPHLASITAPLT